MVLSDFLLKSIIVLMRIPEISIRSQDSDYDICQNHYKGNVFNNLVQFLYSVYVVSYILFGASFVMVILLAIFCIVYELIIIEF